MRKLKLKRSPHQARLLVRLKKAAEILGVETLLPARSFLRRTKRIFR